MDNQPTRSIGLALSGGGARCFAQVGVIKALEEAGYRVDAIAANSSAAILAAIYATVNDAAELERIVLGIDFARLLDFGEANGISGHDGIMDLLAEHAASRFEDLEIPLAVPAVDIEKAELLIFSKGSLPEPVCASNAFPGLFTPVKYLDRHLVDGGVINNFPVDVIRTMTACPVLAVDVRMPIKPDLNLDEPAPRPGLLGRVGKLLNRNGGEMIDIVMQAYVITQDRLIQVTNALHPPDLILRPELPVDLGSQNFDRVAEAVEIGYRSARDAMAAGDFLRLDPR